MPHDYLNLWLTGAFVAEPGDASGTAYFDVRQREYSPAVLAAIDAQRDWASSLPRIVPSLSVVGGLRGEAADALGIAAGTPVSGGGGDNMLAAIGVGAVVEGPVVVSLGTSGTGFAYRSQPAVDPRGEAAAFCDSTGAWLPLVCTLNCTLATDWITALFGLDYAGLEAALAASPVGARGLTFLPHLGGERTPNCPTGAGVFSGVRADHGVVDFVRAVVEGVTFGLEYALGALRRSGVAASAGDAGGWRRAIRWLGAGVRRRLRGAGDASSRDRGGGHRRGAPGPLGGGWRRCRAFRTGHRAALRAARIGGADGRAGARQTLARGSDRREFVSASLSRQLSKWVAGLGYDDLPEEVVDRAKGVTLQGLASALLGSGHARRRGGAEPDAGGGGRRRRARRRCSWMARD